MLLSATVYLEHFSASYLIWIYLFHFFCCHNFTICNDINILLERPPSAGKPKSPEQPPPEPEPEPQMDAPPEPVGKFISGILDTVDARNNWFHPKSYEILRINAQCRMYRGYVGFK